LATSLVCPECRFPNLPGSVVCLTCKSPIRQGDEPTERIVLPRNAVAPASGSYRAPGSGSNPRPPTGRHVRPDIEDDHLTETMRRRTVGWLVCDPMDPIPLGAVPTVTIGRSRECALVLPHNGVSRVHAVVRVLGRAIHLEDKSTFGTFVNGQRLPSAELKTGDRLAIGPYELRIAAVGKDGKADDGEGTRQMLMPLVDPSATAMAGSLERVPALEVLQGFGFHEKSGTLHVLTPEGVEGIVSLTDGRPVHARFGELTGDEAVLAMALLRRGQFRVLSAAEPGPQSIRASLTELLLEANRRLDEGSR
jgi:hypothetical protein